MNEDRPASPFGGVLRGALALFSTQPVTWAAAAAAAVWVPLFLGDRSLGQYAVLLTVASLVGTAASFGLPEYLVRRVATAPDQADADAASVLVLVTGAAAGMAIALMGALVLLGVPLARGPLLPLALTSMVVGAAQGVLLSVLRGRESYGRFAWLNAGSTVLGITAGILVLAAGGDLTAYLTALLATLVPTTLVTGYASRVRLRNASLSVARLTALVRAALPFLGWNLALRVYGEIDKILLAIFATDAVIGWYAAAYRIVFLPGFIATLIMTPLLPVLSRHAADRGAFRETVRQSVDLVLLTTLPLTALIIGLAPAIPSTLHWSAPFSNSIPLLIILALHVPLAAVDVMLGTALVALHREGRWFGVAMIAVLFNVSLNVVLIPILQSATGNGAIAAALVTLLTELLMLGGALILLPRWALARASAVTAAKAAGSAAAAAGVAWMVHPASFVAAAAAALATYAALALALRAIHFDDFRELGLGSIRRSRARTLAAAVGRADR